MEPLEPAKTNENSGFSKRRVSSILKAPRKSTIFPDPVQHENKVECAKPVEKRNSKRVSFAPDNDVLLFSKDMTNTSPPRRLLQELTTTTTTQNRVQVAVTEDGIQQITGMETLLNAPLHACQQRNKVDFDSGHDFGERTVMFSTDDAVMDMTHSHTINIANDTELLGDFPYQNRTLFSSSGEKKTMFTADDASMGMTLSHTVNMTSGSESLSTGRNMDISLSSSVPGLDPGFKRFLASLSKPSGSSVNPVITRMTSTAGAFSDATVETNSSLKMKMKTQRAEVDKENQAPTSVSSVMEKSQDKPRNIGESSYGGALCPEDDVSMDMTEAQTGRIVGLADDDDHFQCLFPTQEMYSLYDRVSKSAENLKTSQQQSSKTQGSSDSKAVASGNRVQKVITEEGHRQITDMTSLKNPSLYASRQSMSKVNFETEDECREKTRFTVDDVFMDVTQSHTVNIACGPLAPPNQSLDIFRNCRKMDYASSLEERQGATEKGLDPGFKNFLASLSKPKDPSVNPVIARMVQTAVASSKETVDTNSSLAQLETQRADVGKENRSLNTTRSSGESYNGGTICPEDDISMDMTKVQTGRIIGVSDTDDPLQCLFPTLDMYLQSDNLKKAGATLQQQSSEGLGSSNRKGMETAVKASLKTNVQRHQVKFDAEEDCREKTVRFTADDACMDVTQSHTVNIVNNLELQSRQNYDFLPTYGEKTVRFTATDAAMDMTQCLSLNIASKSVSDSVLPVKKQERETCGPPRNRSSSAHGVDPGCKNVLTGLSKPSGLGVNPVITRMTAAPSANIGDFSNLGTICPEGDVSMDMTEVQTGRIIGLTGTDDALQCLFPTEDMYPQSGNSKRAEMTPGQQSSEGLRSPKETSLKASLKTKMQRHQVKFDTQDNCREKTVKFTANNAAMDVTRSYTVNIATELELQSHQNVDFLPTDGEKTMRFTANDATMDVTRSHTVNIATDVEPQSHQNVDFLPTGGEKTIRFTANDAAMDVTRSHTVNLATDLKPQSHLNVDFLPTGGEKTMRFTANDATMDVTRSHTVNIATDLKPQSHLNVDFLPTGGEKTMRFTANDATMDVTRSHTVNLATDLKPQSHLNVDFLPTGGEKTMRFTANDATMDVTRSHTVNIATDVEPQSHQNVDFLPTGREKTMRFTANDATMDVTRSHTVNIATDLEPQSHQNVDFLPTGGEKTMRFTSNDATMDVTQSHTVNIATDLEPQSHLNVDFLPTGGEKTMRFTSNDATMDVTQSHTVNIATDLEPQSHLNVDFLPTGGEKRMRFTANDATMDVTQSHTVNIATDLEPQSHLNVDFLPTGREKTMRFTANDATMDVTRSHTVNIATDLEPQSHQNVDFLPTGGEKRMRFTANDAAMDITQCITENIASNLVSDSVLSQKQGPNILSTCGNMDFPLTVKKRGETAGSQRNRSSSALSLDPGYKNVLSKTSGSLANPVVTKAVATSFQETVDANGFLGQLKTQRASVNNENEAPGVVSAVMEKSVNKTMKNEQSSNGNSDHSEVDVSMDMMEAQTRCILGETCTDEPPQCLSSPQDLYTSSDHLKKTDMTSQQSKETLGPSNRNGVEITNLPDSLDSNETETRKEPELRSETSPLTQKLKNSPSAVDHDVDAFPSRKSRRTSIADLQSKIRRLSHMINTSPNTIAMDSCTAPFPQLDHDLDKDKNKSLPFVEPELEMGLVNNEENTQAQCSPQGEQPSITTTPFKLKTQQLMSRLSMGGFKPKLPQRSKTGHPKKVASSHVNSMGEHTRTITISVPNQLSNLDHGESDIYEEELGSFEDLSETLDIKSPQKVTENVSPSQEFNMDEALEDDISDEVFLGAVHGRPLPEDENYPEDEKRMKASIETGVDIVEMGLQSHVTKCDGNITMAPSVTTQTVDSFNNTDTASTKYEATFESTFKQSLFESQLEDYGSDVQKKLDDGTITVLEFFKLFNIHFVIHDPRQSILPSRFLPDEDRTPMDLLKDRHIFHPKQMVYETDVLKLTEQVEGLKFRMRDLDKPLKTVNRPLWEELRNSSEEELKLFGAKLKERNNFFRKMSKVQSHEMKEVLYSNLVQANREEQQKLRATIGKADEMIKSLDDCISELEKELAAVEEKGVDDKPSLKSLQEGLKEITETLADRDRQIAELEMQKKQNSIKLNTLKAETRNLENHVTMLNLVNEWRVGETRGNCTFYTFLHETLYLQLVYENANGNETERKISDISFKRQLDDEKSQGHARLVHKLVSQYIEGETAWVEKYPTHAHVPKLLHDVGLVVSHCRLLGEEIRLLKMWGGLRLDILDISCVDTQVRIVFCSLEKFSKFEVIFSVSLTNHLYVLQVQSFKSIIGSTTIQQIEEIVASFSPARNLLTKIVKKIHESL